MFVKMNTVTKPKKSGTGNVVRASNYLIRKPSNLQSNGNLTRAKEKKSNNENKGLDSSASPNK